MTDLDKIEIDFFRNLLKNIEILDERVAALEQRLNNLSNKNVFS